MSTTSSPPSVTIGGVTYPQPHDNGKLARKIAGWAVFGCVVRVWQLGILKKPLSTNPQVYGYSVVGWGGVGYAAYHIERRQKYLLARKRLEIEESRSKERGLLNDGSLGNALPA